MKKFVCTVCGYVYEGEAAPVEGAFSDCLMKQIAELEERKNKKIRGEDKNN